MNEYVLDKHDLICLVKGKHPTYAIIEKLEAKNLGRFSDQRGWNWDDSSLGALNELELWNLHMLLKVNSL
jgi:hypothetical protein